MRLLKPAWVNHNGKPIFSVDIHPDGSRFATGGVGEDLCSGKVVIWSMDSVREEKIEKDQNSPKILCQMDNHLACVNCVRWSHGGKTLVSAGDDKLIMVWQHVKGAGPSTLFGTGGRIVNIEHWKCMSTLRGHTGDVLDIAWSPQDAWLASCSVDNTVVVWNAHRFPEKLAVLTGHTGLVKGVTWDPIGRYIASQSDDKSLRIWRTLDWQEEAKVEKPFQECGGTTHVLRLDWSPDGSFIVSAHAMNNSGPTAQCIEREGWNMSVDFVGHRKAVTVVRFNQKIFKRNIEDNKMDEYTCCAVGSRDRSLSVWLTSLKRPLVVIHDLFENSVLDIAWSPKMPEILCCSWDGSVAYIDFETEEIGQPLSQYEMCNYHEKIYGKSLASGDDSKSRSLLIESADILALQQTVTDNWSTNKPEKVSVSQKQKIPPQARNRQIEIITADGRRRITPIMISSSAEIDESLEPFLSANSNIEFQSSTEPTKIVIEKIDHSSNRSRPSDSPSSPSVVQKPASTAEHDKHPESLVENCREKTSFLKKNENVTSKPLSMKTKRTISQSGLASKKMREKEPTKAVTPSVMEAEIIKEAVNIDSKAKYLPSVKDPMKCFSKQTTTKDGKVLMLEVNNFLHLGSTALHKLSYMVDSVPEWEQVFTAPIVLTTLSSEIVAVATHDRRLYILSSRGRQLFSPMVLAAGVVVLECTSFYVLAVIQTAYASAWNVQNKTTLMKSESLFPLFSGQDELERALITPNGKIIIQMTSGKSYTYDDRFSSWCLVSDCYNSLNQFSDHLMFPTTSTSGILSTLNNSYKSKSSYSASSLHVTQVSNQRSATVAYLENQVTACRILGSTQEFRFWLQTYVRYLIQEGLELRVRDVFDGLILPSLDDRRDEISSINKHDLLNDLLPLLRSNLKLQRIYTEYKDQLDAMVS